MKQITNVAIGGRNFIISNEAYAILTPGSKGSGQR